MPEKPITPLNRLIYWIREREKIRVKKEAGKPKPWTNDTILQQYKFCNVYREEDTVTKWIAEHWRTPYKNDKDLWFAMCVARFINWPDTLEEIGYPIPWKPARVIYILEQRKKNKLKVWTGAYMIGTNGILADKISYIVNRVLGPLWDARRLLRPTGGQTLGQYASALQRQPGLAGFMAGQVVADLKYTNPLVWADDWHTWAISGPGSKRGMNRLLGNPIKQNWKERDWKYELDHLLPKVNSRLTEQPPLHAQDMQNCLCEFDKYERVRLGQGKPRSKYTGEHNDN